MRKLHYWIAYRTEKHWMNTTVYNTIYYTIFQEISV